MKELSLPRDVADDIALTVLQDQLSHLRHELKNHREHGTWLHPEDVENSEQKLIPALETLIVFFGGEV